MSKDEIRDALVDSLKLDRARKLTVELMLDSRESDIRHLESELERVEKQRDELIVAAKEYLEMLEENGTGTEWELNRIKSLKALASVEGEE